MTIFASHCCSGPMDGVVTEKKITDPDGLTFTRQTFTQVCVVCGKECGASTPVELPDRKQVPLKPGELSAIKNMERMMAEDSELICEMSAALCEWKGYGEKECGGGPVRGLTRDGKKNWCCHNHLASAIARKGVALAKRGRAA